MEKSSKTNESHISVIFSLGSKPLAHDTSNYIRNLEERRTGKPSSTRLSHVYTVDTLGYDYDLKHLDHLGQEEGQGLDGKGYWI